MDEQLLSDCLAFIRSVRDEALDGVDRDDEGPCRIFYARAGDLLERAERRIEP